MSHTIGNSANNESFFCIKCFNDALPFGHQNDTVFNQTAILGLNSSNLDNLEFNISKKEKKMMKFLSKTIFESNDPGIQNSHCKYYSMTNSVQKISMQTNISQYFT